MLKLRINPLVAGDLKGIHDYIADDNEEYAAKTIQEIQTGLYKSVLINPCLIRL